MCIGSIGERRRTPVLMPTNEDSEPEILQVKFRLLLNGVLCSVFLAVCVVCVCENSYYVMIMEKLTTLVYCYMRSMVGFMILVIILRGAN